MRTPRLCLSLVLAAGLAPALPQEPDSDAEHAPAPAAAQAPGSAPTPDAPPPGPQPPAPSQPERSPIWASTEVRFPNYFSSLFYAFYSGDRVEVRVLLHNLGKEPVDLGKDFDVRSGLRVKGEGGRLLEASPAADAGKNSTPPRLAPGQVLGWLGELGETFPAVRTPGSYAIHWESGEWKSSESVVNILPRYNPEVDYEATVATEEGNFTIELFAQDAPVHVRNFVNLVHLGYYNGMPFHTASRNRSIRTGAPGPDGSGSIGYALPAEFSARKHVAGAVSMYRDQRLAGTDSDGSQFFVCLTDLPNRDGKFTVFGHVKQGLDTAKKIGAREPALDPSRPAGSPREPVKIRRIVIQEKARPAAAQG